VGTVDPTITLIPLRELVAVVVEANAKQLAAAGLEVACPAWLPTVSGERDHLYQVFENLLANSMKNAASGSSPRVTISSERRDTELWIKVSDNGPGIPAEHRERVFKLFHRLHPRTTTGTGVGLSIVARVLERHGGRSWVEEAPPGGACFVRAFPQSVISDAG
jgi:signal transduction histidine kinase